MKPGNGATGSLPTHFTDTRSTQAVDAASVLGPVVPNKKKRTDGTQQWNPQRPNNRRALQNSAF